MISAVGTFFMGTAALLGGLAIATFRVQLTRFFRRLMRQTSVPLSSGVLAVSPASHVRQLVVVGVVWCAIGMVFFSQTIRYVGEQPALAGPIGTAAIVVALVLLLAFVLAAVLVVRARGEDSGPRGGGLTTTELAACLSLVGVVVFAVLAFLLL
ncbi:hypothetical protein [Agromyces mangrovi Wang et al. 2018]|uniref:hypothetical protein n=1 Tax=Agromyces mangrovi TaxID=1858653 RepID=UPI00257470CD|nr:hypothetical protein [Agromyces mangrovi]BDZ63554.1 hypothetical protein GCM10025877_04920 [Agromyces mangrovi]